MGVFNPEIEKILFENQIVNIDIKKLDTSEKKFEVPDTIFDLEAILKYASTL